MTKEQIADQIRKFKAAHKCEGQKGLPHGSQCLVCVLQNVYSNLLRRSADEMELNLNITKFAANVVELVNLTKEADAPNPV